MYLYFDNNGILKEIVDDVATRKGNNEVNRLYIYVDGITPKTEWITYQTSDGVQSNETLIETTITKTIPYDRNRDLKYFKNFQEYLFYVATIPSSVLAVSGLTKASVRVALQDDSLMTLGLIIFTIEESVVLQDSFITESQYQYLLNIISNFEELNNTGVIGISTQIVNGAVAPYDQGRIVLSTYNDNFTIATVVQSSTGQNVYSVLDMTFVKQIPYVGTNPFLEGLSINGTNYKVPSKTSQLLNDMGFVQRTVNNLSNYYNKDTIDEKLANIDLSEYYTKTESDGRYVLTTNFSWNNLANKPTSLSDFINDEGFITNTVSNLTNYYDKTTIDNIVATLKTGAFQVVNELPSSGVEGIVYLVGTQAPYTMYIWENNAFLNIGTTEVNLDGYVKGTNLNSNYVILGNGGSNVVASSYTINNQNANNPNSLLTANVINTLLGTKQDVLTEGQGINISDNVISTPVSTTSTTISQESVNKLKYDGKPILVDYAINDDSGNIIADTYATFNDLHSLDIGDITSSSNIYQTLYQNVYENDTTKKNVVIFSTEGFVDSATSLIISGDHVATPYQDNKILIDSVFVLNSDNSATTIISSDTVVIDLGTLSLSGGTLSPTILSEINSAISDNKNIVLKGSVKDGTIISPNVIWGGGQLIALSITISDGITLIILMLSLQDGVYMVFIGGLQEKLESGTNIKTVNGQTILGNGNITVQDPLVSGTNIKTVNNQSLLGAGNIEISGGGSATKMINLGTLTDEGTLDADKLQELMTLFQNGDLIQATFTYNNITYITASAFSAAGAMAIIAYGLSELGSVNCVFLGISSDASYGLYTIPLPTSLKTINDISLIGNGNITVQEPLVSGINIKTINNQSILGLGSVITGLPAKTYSISGISFTTFENGQTATISASDSQIIKNALLNNANVIYCSNPSAYFPVLWSQGSDFLHIFYNDIGKKCGIVGIDTRNNLATVVAAINTDDSTSINLYTVSSTKTGYTKVFNNLEYFSYARVYFKVDGFLDPANSIGDEKYYEAYLSGENKYFASCGKIYEYIVDTSEQGFHVELVSDDSSVIYATDEEVNALFDFSLSSTVEQSTTLWTNVGTAIQTFVNSQKSESDKATLKEALRLGLGIPFCYIFVSNSISNYDTYLDNVVNYFANASLTSQNVSQIISYISESNTIITSIGNDATKTSASQKSQIYNYINSICNVLSWVSKLQTTSVTINKASGENLIVFTTNEPTIPERTISLENLNAFKQQIDNEIGNVLEEGF